MPSVFIQTTFGGCRKRDPSAGEGLYFSVDVETNNVRPMRRPKVRQNFSISEDYPIKVGDLGTKTSHFRKFNSRPMIDL